MISYICLGTNNIEKAAHFYDELLGKLGAKRSYSTDNFIAWSNKPSGVMLSIVKPYDGQPATHGNGTMIALSAPNTETVDIVHKTAVELGGTDEGTPGPRSNNFYAGYFRDLDGNKLNICCLA